MQKVLTDIHTHSSFSHDGISSADEMFCAAKEKGVKYFGVSEHFDYKDGKKLTWTNPQYFAYDRAIKEKYEKDGKMVILVGAEFSQMQSEEFFDVDSATKNEPYFNAVKDLIKEYKPDFVVNSVHSRAFIENNPKDKAYRRYLTEVLQSLEVPFEYDIVAHLGYCERYAPYEDRKFYYAEYKELFDEIFKKIIEKGKILEVNGKSSKEDDGRSFCPNEELLTAYYNAGGREISYASDAHDTKSILQNRETIVAVLKRIGFEYLTVPVCGEHRRIEI